MTEEMKELFTFTEERAKQLAEDLGRYKYYGYTFDDVLKDGSSCTLRIWKENGKAEMLRAYYDAFDATIKKGTPCTIIYYSDRRGATVEEVEFFKSGTLKGKPKRIGVRENVSKCIDYFAGDWEVLDELEDGVEYYTYRRNHTWVNEGGDTRDWGTKLAIGYRHTYEDPSF